MPGRINERPGTGLSPEEFPEGFAARFWRKVERGEPGACWLWRGALFTNGYGVVRVGTQRITAHRVALALVRPVPAKAHVIHLCSDKRCCNPAHLFTYASDWMRTDLVPVTREIAEAVRAWYPALVAYDLARVHRITYGQVIAILSDDDPTLPPLGSARIYVGQRSDSSRSSP